MATYNTSFIINLADLAKILEQIKVAERHAAGENLVDIIGADNALLPVGLRTVDGSFNHLVPGDELTGAADQLFPRLLDPVYRDDQDGDTMPLGPPGGPVVTNTNYDPTIPGGVDPFGVNLHSVADADPRIISNLIVDQTLTNRSALVAALVVAGSANPSADADSILAARDAAEAAAANTATHDAYLAAETSATSVESFIGTILSELAAFRAGVDDNSLDAADAQDAADAALAAQQAKIAQDAVVAALQQPGATVAAADLAAALSLQTALTSLDTALAGYADTVTGPLGDGLSFSEFNALVSAETSATALSATAAANLSALSAAEENTSAAGAAQVLVDLVNAADLNITSDGSIIIEQRSADIGLSPPNSGWMTFFGQFFDHGLDLVTKGGNGTVYVPLQADDPLIAGADHIFGNADDLAPELRFMTLTRATPFVDPVTGRVETQNTTTPFVDQNQTYTSSASHQVFLREYKIDPDGNVVNTGRLIDGANGGIATWAETKAQAADMLGLLFNDFDVHDVPKVVVDPYGKFAPGANGFAQVYVKVAIFNTATGAVTAQPGEFIMEGVAGGLDLHNLGLPPGFTPGVLGPDEIYVTSTVGTGHAFLNDISHHAAPGAVDHDHNPATPKITQTADTDYLDYNGDGAVNQADVDAGVLAGDLVDADGNTVIDIEDLKDVNLDGVIDGKDLVADDRNALTYDNEMLDAHFITGDGRGNENIGLTTVHFIFHAEHNRSVEANKDTLIASGDAAVVNEWLAAGPGGVRNAITQGDLDAINAIVDPADKAAAIDALNWDGERLFQAARFTTEMQYQHMVFEEFARRIQPNVDFFVFTNSADLDPSILAEFAHTVYRFGHSMLTDTVDRLDQDLTTVNSDGVIDDAEQIGLIQAFLNPQAFTASSGAVVDDATSAGAIIRGMSRQVGNEIDEFIVEALRNNLLGLPLDLAVFNIARSRDTGIPSLNETREQLYAMSGHVDVKPYTSWVDFTQHIKHPLSVINFIAAYGTHSSITSEDTLDGKRNAAMLLVLGDHDVDGDGDVDIAPPDRLDFLNATNDYAGGSLGGLNDIDLWIGGLAEELNEFGGQLGSTFNFVFEYQLEHLQNGDRFYYLSRTQGMNFLNLLEPNTFSDIIMRNTDLGDLHATHLSAEIMEVPDMILELDALVRQEDYSGADTKAPGYDPDPADRSLLDVKHDDPFLQAIDPKVFRQLGTTDIDGNGFVDGNILRFSGGEHVVLGGTEGNDSLYGDKGIDTLWGDGGNDYLNPGMESDQVFGGDGDDIIEDPFGDDFLRGEAGDDVIVNGSGLDLLFGGEGQDFIMAATDTTEVFAGPGNDFVLGGTAPDVLLGNEGDDWIEGGEGFDGLSGENSELFFNSVIVGHDILNGQGNDTDYDGENGDDIMVQSVGIQRSNGMDGFDWGIHKGDPNGADSDLGIRPFDTREALILRDRFDSVEGLSGWKHDDILTGAIRPRLGENFADALTQAGVDRIVGMREFLPQDDALSNEVVFESDINIGGEIILGGDGSDVIRGNIGNDILDGDAWLNVRISVHATKDLSLADEIFTVDSLTSIVSGTGNAALDGKSLADLMRTGVINPGQLQAVREILFDDTEVDTTILNGHDRDIAVFSDVLANYTIETDGVGGPIGDGDGDGFITVTHNVPVGGGGGGATINDGIDKIRNFEILSFADGNVFLDPTIVNAPATGLLAIIDGGNPGITVGEPLTAALGTVDDVNGLPPISAFTFTWQFEPDPVGAPGVWADVADPLTGDPVTGVTFIPTAAHELDGLALRVVGRFLDGDGIPETVVSGPTDPVAPAVSTVATEGDDIIVGTLNDDNGIVFPILQGLGGDDNISGLAGNDILVGGRLPAGLIPGDNAGNDILDGGPGIDIALFFGDPANFLFSLAPDGTFEVVDNLTAEEDGIINIETIRFDNNGVITDFNVADILDGSILIGTGGDDTFDPVAPVGGDFFTTDFGDEIDARDGADTINAGASADLIGGGLGDDIIDSGGGNDVVGGGSGTNDIRLRLGDETLLVGLTETGTDTVRNDGGIERISVGQIITSTGGPTPPNAGTVSLTTEAPGAITSIDAQNDGAGNLVLTVNAARAVIITDHFNDVANAAEFINFNGNTYAGFALGAADYAISASTPATGVPGVNTLIAGTAGTDALDGSTGNDLLFGGAGTDALNGGSGNDLLDGGADADVMTGGLGDDTFSVDDAGDTATDVPGAVGGIDLVLAAATHTLSDNVENLTLLGLAPIDGTGNTGANVITGNGVANTLSGLGGDDTLIGGGGTDALLGGAGNDTLNGGILADSLQGGADNDTYQIGLGAGNDTIVESLGTAVAGTADRIVIQTGGAALTNLNFSDSNVNTPVGNLVMTVNGQQITATNHFAAAANALELINFDGSSIAGYQLGLGDYALSTDDAGIRTAAAGVNTVLSGDTNGQTLTGDTGNDLLFGNGGTDTLNGGAGNDLLAGGTGTDTLNGGAGNDTYLVNIGDGNDTINETGGSADRIVIRTAGAALTALSFNDSSAATDTGNLVIAFNGQTTTVNDHFDNSAVDEDVELINFDNGSFGGYALGTGDYAISTSDPATNIRGGAAAGVNTLIAGENGNNTLTGDTGNDLLFGNGGTDSLVGGAGNDLLIGGTGTDTAVFTGSLSDYGFALNGGGNLVVSDNRAGSPDGSDTLIGVERAQFGADPSVALRIGTAGDNNFAAAAPPELFLGFGGSDTVTYAGGTAINANLATGTATNGDRYISIENLTGGTGGDTLTGDGLSNVLSGGGGTDTLNGGAGGDFLIGGGGLADTINTGAADDNLRDSIRFTATNEYGDSVTNFDATGTAAEVDRVEFGGALNGNFDDGQNNDTILFGSGDGAAGTVTVTIGQNNIDIEALYLSGDNGEGVTGINLGNASQVAAAFNAEFNITAANDEDALLVINDTDGDNFAVWQWIQAGGAASEMAAGELALIGIFQGNATVTTNSVAFF